MAVLQQVLVPNATVVATGASLTGAATIEAALSDGVDTSYVSWTAGTGGRLVMDFTTYALPAGAVVSLVENVLRGYYANNQVTFRRLGATTSAPQGLTASYNNLHNTYSTDSAGQAVQTQAHVDGYQMEVVIPANAVISKLEVWLWYATPPTAPTGLTPTGTITTTSPAVTWQHNGGGAAQTNYRVMVFDSANYPAGAPDVAPNAAYDTGTVASNANSTVVGPLSPNKTYRAYVQTSNTTVGVIQPSPWAFTTFTVTASPPVISSLVATADPTTGSISVVATNTTPVWETLTVQATYDAGVTWVPVRGWTNKAVTTTPQTIVDSEAPNDTPARYRARASRLQVGVVVTSDWVLSNTVQWNNSSNDTWVKDPAHPERNMRVCLSALPESVYARTVGVFRPIGAMYPVTVSDVLQAPTSSVQVLTRTRAEETALLSLLSAPVLLVQPPNTAWSFGSRYVATGTIVEGRTSPTSPSANRLFTIELTVIDRPA